jgi:hypothetical protein
MLLEDSATYRTPGEEPRTVEPLDDPDFIGAEAALKRAAAKAIERAKAAGLEPVIVQPAVSSDKPELGESPTG